MAKTKKINLALQGGGAHGAYTWGVLDRLIEETDVEIESLSGTSAGAINAALLADGWVKNGVEGAKENLEFFWRRTAEIARMTPLHAFAANPFGVFNLDESPFFQWHQTLSMIYSPYVTNPIGYNPLRDILQQTINLEHVHECNCFKLFIAATRVSDGKPKVFVNEEVTIDALMASSCLPYMHHAVEINGEEYWDGGFTGNPVLWPIVYNCDSNDIMIVQINPIKRSTDYPRSGSEIMSRMQEISFNASLIAEIRAIHFVHKLLDQGKLNSDEYRYMNLHMIERPMEMRKLNGTSKFNVTWEFFEYLHGLGREACEDWLAQNKSKIGKSSSFDFAEIFLKTPDLNMMKSKKGQSDKTAA